ncbi:MAG: CHAT domain-containing protein [Archangiaceae bacterium]|nr:CHAT domain-containing protein [Archangiaceae bacterium]
MKSRARLLSAVLLAACAEPSPPPPFSFSVEVAGCAALLEGPRCEVVPGQRLSLWVDAPKGAALELSAAGRRLEAVARPLERGVAFTATVDPGLGAVELTEASGARWSLVLGRFVEAPALVEARRLKASGARDAAATLLDTTRFDAPRDQARAMSLRARLALAAGDLDAAIVQLGRAQAMHRAAHARSDEANDALVRAFAHVERHEPAEARRAVESASDALSLYAEGAAQAGYYLGLAASAEADARGALRHFSDSEERATRLGLQRQLDALEQVSALLRVQLGDFAAALERLERLSAQQGPAPVCDRASLLVNVAWARLSAREAGQAAADAVPALQEALTLFESGCPNANEAANATLDLALAALQRGDLDGVAAALKASRRGQTVGRLASWWVDVEGRLELARGHPAEALKQFKRLESLALASASSEAAWRGLTGQAEALSAAGDRAGALAALARAERELDSEGARAPLPVGLRASLDARDRSARQRVELLLDAGRPAEAFEAARHARARALRWERSAERLAALEPGARARWAVAVSAYTAARDGLDRAATDDWKLPAARLAAARRDRAATIAALERALDEALAALGEPATPHLAAVPAGEVWLLAFPAAGDRWVAFAASSGSVSARSFTASSVADEQGWAAALLEPFERELSAATQVGVLAYGRVRELEVHALPLHGAPLLHALPVHYVLDVGSSAEPAAPTRGALVVADPRGDLPFARLEAAGVSQALRESAPLVLSGRAASAPAVREALGRSDLFHYAGHGSVGDSSAWDARLPLADGQLTAADVLALPRVPELVVLSGCDTARAARGGAEPLGLAQAFVAAGARVVIASTGTVADAAALRLVSSLYADAAPTPETAVRALQRAADADRDAGGRDWRAFRAFTP